MPCLHSPVVPMSDRLKDLEAELGKVFGRYSKWKLRCQEQDATTTEEKIKLAEAVLAEPCTGTVAEGRSCAEPNSDRSFSQINAVWNLAC